MLPSTIHTLSGRKIKWVNVTAISEVELQYLAREFNLHSLDLKDCQPPLQRPKIVPRDTYIFGIFVFPTFNSRTREIEQHEVDIFFLKDTVITVHNNSFPELRDFFALLELNAELRDKLTAQPIGFVSQLLDELYDFCFPLLFHISSDIDALSEGVRHGASRATVHEILRLKNNVVAFRKALQPHRGMLTRAISLFPQILKIKKSDTHYFDRLIDHTSEIWDHLETYYHAIDAVEDTHRTAISYRLNEIMKTLTIFSIVIMSLTLFTNIFIVPALSTPLLGNYGDFWAMLGIMTLLTISAIGIFKRKGWL